MPLFGNKFNPKKTPPRKSGSLSNLSLDATRRQQEFGIDYGKITMKLGDAEMAFEDGNWVPTKETTIASTKEINLWRTKADKLTEENRLLNVKMELLLDMSADLSAENKLLESEIAELKRTLREMS